MTLTVETPAATRGTTNGNQRGSSYTRRARRAWMLITFASNIPGFCRCYRCGSLLYNPDAPPFTPGGEGQITQQYTPEFLKRYGYQVQRSQPLTVDRIIPGCRGGTYRRNNIRPCCSGCNSETGGGLRA